MNLYSVSSLVAFVVCAYLAFFVYFKGKKNYFNKAFSIATISMGTWCLFPFLSAISPTDSCALFWTRIAYIAAFLTPAAFLNFIFIVLGIETIQSKRSVMVLSYLLSAVLALSMSFNPYFITGVMRFRPYFRVIPGVLYPVFILFFGILCTYVVFSAFQVYRGALGYKKNQLRYLFLAFFLAYTSGIIHFLSAYLGQEPFPHDFLIIAYSLVLFYAIFKHRLMDITLVLTRTTIFIVVYVLVLGLPFAIAVGARAQLITLMGGQWWIAPLGLMGVLATVGPFMYIYLQRKAEASLLKEQRRYQQTLKQASVGMTRIRNLHKLLDLITHIVTKTVRISFAAIYLYDGQRNEYVLQVSRDRGRSFIPALPADDALIAAFLGRHEPIIYEEVKRQIQDSGDASSRSVEESMRRLEASVVIPSFLEYRLTGLIVLGDKLSGQIYTPEDLNVFQVLASQAALAIENAQFYAEAKEMQEQIAQAEKMATIGTMADGLSHQINNRFYALSLIASDSIDTIKMTDTAQCSPEVKAMIQDVGKALERIQVNVIQGGEVVKGILKYTRKGDEGFEALTLNQILDGTLDMIQYKIRLSEVDIVRDYPAEAPCIHGNLVQLQEVFFNFIDNAYDAIMERAAALKEPGYRGKINISIHNKKEGFVTIIIEDNGMGIKDSNNKKVFTPFFTTKTSSRKGTGLGLYVIRRVITDLHKGMITFESAHQKGTRFTVDLPTAPAA